MKLAKPGGRASRRIEKELEKIRREGNPALTIIDQSPDTWFVAFSGTNGTIYEGEEFTLQVRFPEDYPMEAPEVVFSSAAPVHPHIYSNGHICLNILSEDWSPALTVESVCISILSMLSSNTVKVRPPDNDRYVSMPRSTPKNTRFVYHDDSV